jgi:hypothetical protein
MLVLEPSRRVTIEQIKRHRWMTVEMNEMPIVVNTGISTPVCEPNDQILRIMQNLGIDAQRTRESLKVRAFHSFENVKTGQIILFYFSIVKQL